MVRFEEFGILSKAEEVILARSRNKRYTPKSDDKASNKLSRLSQTILFTGYQCFICRRIRCDCMDQRHSQQCRRPTRQRGKFTISPDLLLPDFYSLGKVLNVFQFLRSINRHKCGKFFRNRQSFHRWWRSYSYTCSK